MRQSIFQRPAVTPFVECPNCKQLLEYGLERCPRCLEEIEQNYALISAAVVQYNNQACSSANTIKSLDAAVVISILSSAYAYFVGMPGTFIIAAILPSMCLAAILIWFYRYGRFRMGDEDFLKAKRAMWASLKLWLGLLLVQLLLFIYMLKTTGPRP
jgi:hypothetical protein